MMQAVLIPYLIDSRLDDGTKQIEDYAARCTKTKSKILGGSGAHKAVDNKMEHHINMHMYIWISIYIYGRVPYNPWY